MMSKTMQRLFSLFFIFFSVIFSVPSLYAEPVQVTATMDKRSVQVNEEITLNIRVAGAQGNLQAPRVPVSEAFDVFYTGRASHITFINNVSTSMIEFTYVLVPKTAGKFTLPPVDVFIGGATYRTGPIEVEVLGNAGQLGRTAPMPGQAQPVPSGGAGPMYPAGSPAVQQPPQATYDPNDDNIFVTATVDKNVVFPGEEILLTYSLYTRYDTRYEGFGEEPEMSGFWIEEFPMEREIPRENTRMNGKRYVKADIRKIALFPTAPAEYTIKPGDIKVSIRKETQMESPFDEFFNDSFFSGGGFFTRRESRILKPEPVHITVKPLPEQGKPASFQGAVGNYRMVASVDKKSVKQNEPVTMKLEISGEGNVETLKSPKLPELPDFKVYESDSSAQLFKTGYVIGGRKNFEFIFIPLKAGKMIIPKLEFSFFNPGQVAYQTIQTNEFVIDVEPSDQPFQLPKGLDQPDAFKKDLKVEAHDIYSIWDKLPNPIPAFAGNSLFYGVLLMDILMTILVLIGFWREHMEQLFAKDSSLKRKLLARSQAEAGIRHLNKLARSSKHEDTVLYFEEIDKILTQYLTDKFNLSAYGTTRVDLERQLEYALGANDPLYQSIIELYNICDEARFAKGELPANLKSEALKILRKTIARVEKMRR